MVEDGKAMMNRGRDGESYKYKPIDTTKRTKAKLSC